MMTIKELRTAIANLPDEMAVTLSYDGMSGIDPQSVDLMSGGCDEEYFELCAGEYNGGRDFQAMECLWAIEGERWDMR
jgi:hypothetical protein